MHVNSLDKITKKLIKYFLLIISLVIGICLVISSVFFSKTYINHQYSTLEEMAQTTILAIKEGIKPQSLNTPGVLIKNYTIIPIGKMKSTNFKGININSLNEKDTFTNSSGQSFLTYKLNSDIGTLILIKSKEDVNHYLTIVYATLILVFIIFILISIPFLIYLGKKFTKPILDLQSYSKEISNGNFNAPISTGSFQEFNELEESLKSMAESLNKKYSMQRDFIANVSHDFKTPLSIIRNYSEALSDGILDDEDIKSTGKLLIGEVDRLNKLVIDILHLSKLQSSKALLDLNPFSLESLLLNTHEKFKPLCNKRNISLRLIVDPLIENFNVSTTIIGDHIYLSRVIDNFIDNALKISYDDSKIDIMLSLIHSNDTTSLKVSIKDYGDGIDENKLSTIWDKYYKDNSKGGMGLGLAICKEILEKHKFAYGVVSEKGLGSEFFFLVPSTSLKGETNGKLQ